MKIAVFCSRFPYPLERGDKLRLYYQLRELAKMHDIYLFCVDVQASIDDKHVQHIRSFCKEVYVESVSKYEQLSGILRSMVSKTPFQTNMLFSQRITQKFNKIIDQLDIDICYCQLIRVAPYAIPLKMPKVLDYMDAFSVSMSKRSTIARFPVNLLYQWEAKKVAHYEQEMLHLFDQTTIISKQDAEGLGLKTGVVIENGIDTDFFSVNPNKRPTYDVVFIGNLGYLPNVEACEFLVEKVAVAYTSITGKSLQILLAGARPDARIMRLQQENITIKSWMEDIRLAYRDAKIMVAPIFSGTGQQNKILEAMALGVLCITTSSCADSLNAKHQEHLLVADDEKAMAKQIELVLQNESAYDHIRKQGRDFVAASFQWKDKVAKLNDIFEAIHQ